MKPRNSASATAIAAMLGIVFLPAIADGQQYELVPMEGRSNSDLYQAAYGDGGRIGMFRDVDNDRRPEFIVLSENGRQLELTVLDIVTNEPRLRLVVGEREAAGLEAINLDEDPELEYVVGFGSRAGDRVLKALLWTATAVVSHGLLAAIMPTNVDLWNVRAFDDDGSMLWERDVHAENWRNPRMKWIAVDPGGRGATILLTDDGPNTLVGISAEDGTTIWTQNLYSGTKASKRSFQPMTDGTRTFAVSASKRDVLVLDPVDGETILDTTLESEISSLLGYQIYDTDDDRGFLSYDEDRSELRMNSLSSGQTLWTHRIEDIHHVLSPSGGERVIAVREDGAQILAVDGTLVADMTAPEEIGEGTTPILVDLDGDGSMELLYRSGRERVVAWRPETGEWLWIGHVGAKEFVTASRDLDDDGWVDVPVRTAGQSGRWLSGRTGETLATVYSVGTELLIGDFDQNSTVEVFWGRWYEMFRVDRPDVPLLWSDLDLESSTLFSQAEAALQLIRD